MAGSLPNFHKMDSRSACIQGVLKVKVKVKDHVIRALSWILGMSYSVIDGLVLVFTSLQTDTTGRLGNWNWKGSKGLKPRTLLMVLL